VPVFIGHAEAVNVEFTRPITVEEARKALRDFAGISVVDHRADEGYATPAEIAGEDLVYVSRIRKDPTVANGLTLWVVADNLRKGAATNAVQIAEILAGRYLHRKGRVASQRRIASALS
jgi:aspartate-semialdehyde dehydrogenase